jgi:hypothetical protein
LADHFRIVEIPSLRVAKANNISVHNEANSQSQSRGNDDDCHAMDFRSFPQDKTDPMNWRARCVA